MDEKTPEFLKIYTEFLSKLGQHIRFCQVCSFLNDTINTVSIDYVYFLDHKNSKPKFIQTIYDTERVIEEEEQRL